VAQNDENTAERRLEQCAEDRYAFANSATHQDRENGALERRKFEEVDRCGVPGYWSLIGKVQRKKSP
jgi:hypothetical protein